VPSNSVQAPGTWSNARAASAAAPEFRSDAREWTASQPASIPVPQRTLPFIEQLLPRVQTARAIVHVRAVSWSGCGVESCRIAVKCNDCGWARLARPLDFAGAISCISTPDCVDSTQSRTGAVAGTAKLFSP